MLKYAIILLDSSSTSFCYADNPNSQSDLMSIDVLKDSIFWAMRENLAVQFVYPDFVLPKSMLEMIDTIDHTDIKHLTDADIIVCNGLSELKNLSLRYRCVALRISKDELLNDWESIAQAVKVQSYLSIVITDLYKMKQQNFDDYYTWLNNLLNEVCQQYVQGLTPRVSLLTERMLLETMNNCNAGYESITIGPNGKFYICPAFYYEDPDNSVGNVKTGLNVRNPQLFRTDHAPICRKCDAFHCRRCVWLNRKMTLEVNTPSHEQCVVSHLERNASRELLKRVREYGDFLQGSDIKEIDYLDPFDKIVNKETI